MIVVACSTRCFPLERPTLALARVAWAGFRAAELAWLSGDDPAAEEVQARLAAEGLTLVAVDAGPVAAPSREAALESVAHVGRCVVAARQLGASHVIVTAPPIAEATLENLAWGIARLLSALADLPVRLCVRHARGTLVETWGALATLRRRVDDEAAGAGPPPSSRIALALDPAEAALSGWDALAYTRAALDTTDEAPLGHVYLTDFLDGRRVPLGTGAIDWLELGDALLSGGYAGAVSVLLDGGDPLFAESEAKEACAFARALFPDGEPTPGHGR